MRFALALLFFSPDGSSACSHEHHNDGKRAGHSQNTQDLKTKANVSVFIIYAMVLKQPLRQCKVQPPLLVDGLFCECSGLAQEVAPNSLASRADIYIFVQVCAR